jgi:DNA topoisomerase-1
MKLGYEKEDGERFHRVRFNEITREAIAAAVEHPGDIDVRQVEAQQARRILDRLVGYGLSPLLWKKISPVDPVSRQPLSAGRVQSVAVRLVVERERERRRFHTATWWDLTAALSRAEKGFEARLASVGGTRVAGGADFDPDTGQLKSPGSVLRLDEEAARALAERLADTSFTVTAVQAKEVRLRPYAPFTTSTLQQEASRKLGLPARETMRVAQRLYEAGHITYMRTDSVHLSGQAIGAARRRVEALYGETYLSPKPRNYKTKSKGAQEAHEAIRPAGGEMRTAEELGLGGIDAALYELIWKRMMATQMAEAVQDRIAVTLAAADAEFRANGKTLRFAGFLRAYVEGSDDPEAALEDREVLLPPLEEGDDLETREISPQPHETRPPARYTVASLVEALENEGVGRPSTYATILDTIEQRGYVESRGKQLVPTFVAFAVTHLLEDNFPDLVDPGFTSEMEKGLDDIADGEVDWRSFLEDFYRGRGGFERRLAEREESIDPREASTLEFHDMRPSVRIGRFGPYLELEETEGEPLRVSLPEGLAPADLTPEVAERLLEQKEKADEPLGTHPDTGEPVYLLVGRYGPFVQLGEQVEDGPKPKRVSLLEGMEVEDVDLATALRLLELPRILGTHPETGEDVAAGVGRYGPYVVHDGDFRSLEDEDDVLTVGLDRALELLARPKRGRRSGPKVIRELGPHPEDGEVVELMKGRYGPYVRHDGVNASLPKGEEPETTTLERALELLTAKRASGGGRGRGGRRGRKGRSRGGRRS